MDGSAKVPVPARAGMKRSAPDTASGDVGKRLRLGGRYWRVEPDLARSLPWCSLCDEGLVQKHLCKDTRHATCVECRDKLLAYGYGCPQCRKPPAKRKTRRHKDRTLHEGQAFLRQTVRVRCLECQSWEGPIVQAAQHGAHCGEREHACRWQHDGCAWTGWQDDLEPHEEQCQWRAVICPLPGCGQQIPLCQQEAHSAACDYRPARHGALVTTAGKLQQLERLHQLCQQGVLLDKGQDEARLQLTQCFPLLYEAVANAVPAGSGDSEAACPWQCGFRTTMARMDAHYAHCPRYLVTCTFCPHRLTRAELGEHLQTCEDRPVSCPRGCGAAGLRARDISATGLHARECRVLSCTDCQALLRCEPGVNPDFVRAVHRAGCSSRPVRCHWCFGLHPRDRFEPLSAACRERLAGWKPLFRGQPLVLNPAATGPVYTTEAGRENAIFIRLSGPWLQTQGACDKEDVNLTPGLRFVWKGLPCSVEFSYQNDQLGFVLESSSPGCQTMRFAASLCQEDGQLLEELGTVRKKARQAYELAAAGDRPEPRLKLEDGATDWTPLHSLNALGSQNSASPAVVLYLDRKSCRA